MRKYLLIVASLLLAPAAAWAGGYSVPNYFPRDLSMAGSLTAAQEGASATYGNPSALARTEGFNLALSATLIDIRSTWNDPFVGQGSDPFTQDPNYQQSWSMIAKGVFPPAIFASYGLKLKNPFLEGEDLRVAGGIGFNIPFGGNVFWPDKWPGRFDIITVERRIFATYFMLAVEPVKWFRLGGGLIWYRGTEKLGQVATAGALPNFETRAELGTAGDAFSFDVSAEFQPIPPLRIGIDYKHQAPMLLEGQAHFFNPAPQLAGRGLVDQSVQHELTMPNVLHVGAAYQVLPSLLVTAAFSWDRYIVYDKDAFVGPLFNITVARNYHNSHTFRGGAEYSPIENLKVRAGVLRDISPTPKEWMSPTIPDSNVWGVSVGASYNLRQWVENMEIYAAYFHAFFDSTSTVNTPQYVLPGNYDTFANIASIGLTWGWDPMKK